MKCVLRMLSSGKHHLIVYASLAQYVLLQQMILSIVKHVKNNFS